VPLADWTPSIGLADTALAGGAPGLALQISDQLLARNPRDTQALIRRGNALSALGRPSEAAGSFNNVLEIDSTSIPALLGLGRIQLSQDPAAAELLFAQVMIQDPRNGVALSNLGVARDLQGHHAAAQEAYRLALGVTPASVPVQVNLGLSLALSGDGAGSLKLLQPLAAAPGAAPRVRQDLALALTLGGHRNEASSVLSADLPADQVRGTLDGFEALRQ
jgi:Flp pilus assembly protein TadD